METMNSAASPKEKMEALLKGSGIPYKSIQVCGSKIFITTNTLVIANFWAKFLKKTGVLIVSSPTESFDFGDNDSEESAVRVYRVQASV